MKKLAMWLLPLSTCVLGWPPETGRLTAADYWVSASGDNAAAPCSGSLTTCCSSTTPGWHRLR